MFWILLTILIIIGWIIYSRRKSTVTLSEDQAEMALGLIRKERDEIEKKRQGLIDNATADGKTVSLEDIFSHIEIKSDSVKYELEKVKRELFDKYGPNIPVDAVYRIMKQFDPDKESPWSDNPGCFERHLQRREGNLLFPPERRIVTIKEINEAQERDRSEQRLFVENVKQFVSSTTELTELENSIPIDRAFSIFKEIQELLEEAASIGGNIGENVQTLKSTEEELIRLLNKVVPDGAEQLEKAHSLSILKRSPYAAQASRKDTPIIKEEEIPALLSEDLETISFAGYLSRAFAPDYRPNEADIRKHLEKVVNYGFSKERAAQIIAAWNEMEESALDKEGFIYRK